RRRTYGQGGRASGLAWQDPPAIARPAPGGPRPRSAQRRLRPRVRSAPADRDGWFVHARLVFHHALLGAPAAEGPASGVARLRLVRDRRLCGARRRDAACCHPRRGRCPGGRGGEPLRDPPSARAITLHIAAAARAPPGRVAQIATSPRSCSSLRSKSARFASTRVVGAPVARSSRTPAVTRRTITSARAASPATTGGVSPSRSQITAGTTAYDRRFDRGRSEERRGG